MLDRLGGCGGNRQRLRVGVADVLGGEDDHAPDDEAGVLATLEHHGQVVQRGVGVRATRGLDPGRGVVVVAVAALVVEDRPPLQGVLGPLQGDPLARPARGRSRLASSSAFRAVRASPSLRAARNSSAPRSTSTAPAAARSSTTSTSSAVRACRAYTRRRESSAPLTSKAGFSVVAPISVTSPSSTAGSRASCWALLKRWISSRNRIVSLPLACRRCAGPLDHLAHLCPPRLHRAQLFEGGRGGLREDPRERRLARARGPVEDHRMGPAGVDRGPQGRALGQQVRLSHEVPERVWADPCGERCRGAGVPLLRGPSFTGSGWDSGPKRVSIGSVVVPASRCSPNERRKVAPKHRRMSRFGD